jgi:hypothetical protein
MLETLELSPLIPDLARAWFACLFVVLIKLALDAYRGRLTSLLSAAYQWIAVAVTVSIGIVVTEAHSRHLISSGVKVFVLVMLTALWIMAAIKPETEAAPEPDEEGADA